MAKKLVSVSASGAHPPVHPVAPRRSVGGIVATIIAWLLALGAGGALAYVLQQNGQKLASAQSALQAQEAAAATATATAKAALETRMAAAKAAFTEEEEALKTANAAVKTLATDKTALDAELRRLQSKQAKAEDSLQNTNDTVRSALTGVEGAAAGTLSEANDDAKIEALGKVRDGLKQQVADALAAKARRDKAEEDAEARKKGATPVAAAAAKADDFDYKKNLKISVSPTQIPQKGGVTKYRYNVQLKNQDMKQDLLGMHLIVMGFAENNGQYTVFLKDDNEFDLRHVASFEYRTVDGFSTAKRDGWMLFVTDKDNKVQATATNTAALEPYAEKIILIKQGQLFNRHGGLVIPPPVVTTVPGQPAQPGVPSNTPLR